MVQWCSNQQISWLLLHLLIHSCIKVVTSTRIVTENLGSTCECKCNGRFVDFLWQCKCSFLTIRWLPLQLCNVSVPGDFLWHAVVYVMLPAQCSCVTLSLYQATSSDSAAVSPHRLPPLCNRRIPHFVSQCWTIFSYKRFSVSVLDDLCYIKRLFKEHLADSKRISASTKLPARWLPLKALQNDTQLPQSYQKWRLSKLCKTTLSLY